MFHFIFRLKLIFFIRHDFKKMRFLITYSSQNKGKQTRFLPLSVSYCCAARKYLDSL